MAIANQLRRPAGTVADAKQAVTGAVLITGGAGFIGSNLADRLAREGCAVTVLDALARDGVERNLAWLRERHGGRMRAVIGDIRDAAAVAAAARGAAAIFHLAAQVAVTTSLADPREDFEVNVAGHHQRARGGAARSAAPVIFASTNKVYGNLADVLWSWRRTATCPSTAACAPRGVDESQAARLPHPLRLLQGRGRPVRARLRPQRSTCPAACCG